MALDTLAHVVLFDSYLGCDVAPTDSYLGCDVVGRAAECCRVFAGRHSLLTHAEVGDLTVTFGVQQNVVQLQIPVNAQSHVWHLMVPCNKLKIEINVFA